MQVRAIVEPERRGAIMRSHTGTHLVHWALREVLGEHAKQAGSLVEPDSFRFDYAHFGALTPEEAARVEELVNLRILEDHPVRTFVTTYDYAKSLGATALFGEKYRELVRVVEVDDISRELCGGTHAVRTGMLGSFVLLSESGIGANMRRLEALTGREAYRYRKDLEARQQELSRLLKADAGQLVHRAERLLAENRELATKAQQAGRSEVASAAERLESEGTLTEAGGARVLTGTVAGMDVQQMRELAERARERLQPALVGIIGESGGKTNLVVTVSKELVARGLSASAIVKDAGSLLGGGGGGRPDMAVGGGPRSEGTQGALQRVAELAAQALGSG